MTEWVMNEHIYIYIFIYSCLYVHLFLKNPKENKYGAGINSLSEYTL